MWPIVDYLKRPELVVAVQEWFGIEYANSRNEKHIDNDDTFFDQNKPTNLETNQYSNDDEHKKHRRKQGLTIQGFALGDPFCTTNLEPKQKGIESDKTSAEYRITNKFWYYLFIVGTELGDELFYATMIPFWFWNIDGAVGRRIVFVWSVVMYIGQVLKDIIRWPRPGPPVQRLQNKWSIEYGMPSTHAMVRIRQCSRGFISNELFVNRFLVSEWKF